MNVPAQADKPKTEATVPDSVPAAGRRVEKSAGAFRTISEVADELEVPQHVLRFWETKFPQVRPLKRGGGRRYYRPEDVDLLRQIRSLLYHEGYTIKGVQRLMREGALKDRVESIEGEAPDLSQLGDIERRRHEVNAAISQLTALRDRLLALTES